FLYSEQATNLPRPYVKWSCEPARAEDVPAALARAYFTAMQPPHGPTFVSVPVDDWDRSCRLLPHREVSVTVGGDASMLTRAAVGLSIVTNLRLGIRALLAADAPTRLPPPAPGRAPRVPPDRLTDRYLLQQIAALRPPGSIVVEEAPSSRGAMHDYLPMLEPDSFYTCASGGLGHGLPAAVGVALARSE